MFRAHDEFVLSRLFREQRTFPADRELLRRGLFRHWRIGAVIERDVRVDALQDPIGGTEATVLVVFGAEASFRREFGDATETADDISDGMAILADGEPGQLDASGPIALAS